MQGNMITNRDLKLRARLEIAGNFQQLILLVFIATLPGLIANTIRTLSVNMGELYYQLSELMVKLETSEITALQAQETLHTIIDPVLQSKGFIISTAISFLSWLVTPVMTIGLFACMLRQFRGETLTASDVFCRKKLFLRAIGQLLWIALLEIAWMLPGLATMVLGLFAYIQTGLAWLTNLLVNAGSVMMLYFGLRAAMSYSQAQFVLADNTYMSIRSSVRRSRDIMHTRRFSFAMLYLSFLLLLFLQVAVESLLSGISPVISMVAGLAFDLFINLYMYMTFAAFYLRENDGRLPPEHHSSKQA